MQIRQFARFAQNDAVPVPEFVRKVSLLFPPRFLRLVMGRPRARQPAHYAKVSAFEAFPAEEMLI
jgi:hypothetical protein